MEKTVCIICEKEKDGARIADDSVIAFIRGVKKRLNIARNNVLIVCPDCMEAYKKKRSDFERALVQHVAIGVLVLAAFVVLPFLGRGFSSITSFLMSVFFGILVALFILALSLTRYYPSLERKEGEELPEPKGFFSFLSKKPGKEAQAREAKPAKAEREKPTRPEKPKPKPKKRK